ncbi:MAG: PQQ-binding-like beta-propeller repeat protein [Rhodovarius sp.]|nr:PQQ-like beta-propeller repeat protein [Rhodovarius sp.]MCX7931019.1 PQQ-like beta-propeller repeat protein [Rhodovarius sp.]MDW8315342.1 PQQ-binding-like beta-propeller repeat protein [Rhodovarius sp.]
MTARRTLLLGGASALLGGCETLTDLADRILGTRKTPLPGERRPVLAGVTESLRVDPAAARLPMVLPPPRVNDSWPQAGGQADHAPGHLALPRPLREVWRTDIGTGMGFRHRMSAGPIVAAETVFAMDAFGWVSALDAGRGSRRWQIDTRPRQERDGALGGGIAFDQGVLYVVTGLREALAIEPADGRIRWRAPLPAPARGGLAVAEGRLFVATIDNQVLCLSAEDGQRLWAFRGPETTTLPFGLAAPAVAEGMVVAGLPSGEVTALRVSDGRQLWLESVGAARIVAASIAEMGAVAAKPVVDRGRVFAVGMGGSTISLDLRSGRRVWERPVGGFQPVASAGDWVFVCGRDGQVAAIMREEGRVRWITELPLYTDPARRRGLITWGPPTLAGGRLILAGSHGGLVELEADSGEIASESRMPGGAQLQPAVANNTLYYLADNGTVVALR